MISPCVNAGDRPRRVEQHPLVGAEVECEVVAEIEEKEARADETHG